MKRILATLALSVLTIVPASASATDRHAAIALHHTQAIAVPLVVQYGDSSSIQLLVTPLATPLVIVPLATPTHGHVALPLVRHRRAIVRCH
jgi:hypothetical protein